MHWTEQDQMNKDHLTNPQTGDYWHDMYNPVCIVIASDGDTVTLCRKIKEISDHSWTWDYKKIETMPLTDFSVWLHYKSPTLNNHTWASVAPGAMGHLDCFAQSVNQET